MSAASASLPFFKVSGAGNDFVALVDAPAPSAEQVRAWCRRGLSVGADGVFVLARGGTGAVRMTYFNADGGGAALCVNGTRCAARLAFELGWSAGEDAVTVETGAGPLRAHRRGPDEVALEVPAPSGPVEEREVEVDGRRVAGRFVLVGVPHFVVEQPEGVAAAPVATLGPRLREHPAFAPAGTNVDFVAWGEPGQRPGRLEIRSFERGVEAETLACGTGVLAAVAAGLASGRTTLPVRATTRGGFFLTVEGEAEAGRPRRWSLVGDARIVAEGRLRPDAERLPELPSWR